jgi:hypothetical protein
MKKVLCTIRNRKHFLFIPFSFIVILIALSAGFFSCEIINDVIPGTGDLEVTIDNADVSEAISYTIQLNGRGKAPEDIHTEETTVTFEDLEPGIWSVTVTAFDSGGELVGNGSNDDVEVVKDEVAKVVVKIYPKKLMPPSRPDLISVYDTGASDSDNITNETEGLMIVVVTEEPVPKVTLKINNRFELLAETNDYILWSVEKTFEIDGDYTITAFAEDEKGNKSDPSEPLKITIDTINYQPEGLCLDPYYDSGKSNTDNITNNTSLTIKGKAEEYSKIFLYVDGNEIKKTSTADNLGLWDIDEVIISTEGTHTITALSEDTAGNRSDISDTLIITIDTTPPSINSCYIEPYSRELSVSVNESGSGLYEMMVWACQLYHDGSGYNSTTEMWITYASSLSGANMPAFESEGSQYGGSGYSKYKAHVQIKDKCGNISNQTTSNTVQCGSDGTCREI